MKPLTPPDYVIACVGNRVDSRCAEAMARVASVLPYLSIRFVDSGWLSPNEVTATTLYWVVDVEVPIHCLPEVSRRVMPLLIPVERDDLKALCKNDRNYSYETAGEATERIAWILKHNATLNCNSEQPLATRQARADGR
jgi:hypothetical protein